MPIGTVKFFNENKGYGFIQPDEGGQDAFVHISAVERAGMRTLRENQRIAYDLEQDRRGKMAAVNLKSAEEATGEAPAAAPKTRRRRPNKRRASTPQTSNSTSPEPPRPGTRRTRQRSTMCASVASVRRGVGRARRPRGADHPHPREPADRKSGRDFAAITQGRSAGAAECVVDPDPHPFADQRSPVLARRTHPELPRRLPNCARQMRSGRILAKLDAILDAVAGNGLAHDQAPAVVQIVRQITSNSAAVGSRAHSAL